MTKCLVTGGAGFIGSHLVNFLLKATDWEIAIWDKLSYAAWGGRRLREIGAIPNPRVQFTQLDLSTLTPHGSLYSPEYIIHLAAETHVDRSIDAPFIFMSSNILGTASILDFARKQRHLKKFLYFSTDEIFGPARGEPFDEWSRYNSSNPYAATKAAGEELALAWANTYGLPVVVSHCCNVFGERQHEEKFIPILVRQIAAGHTVTIHSRPDGTSGSRMYVYAGDVARAIWLMLEHGEIRAKYNIAGREIANNEMAVMVAEIMDKPLRMKEEYPYDSRPGWDFSYRISGEALHELGWKPTENFRALLRQVVKSYGH